MITQKELKELREYLSYDPDTGISIWLKETNYNQRHRVGKRAGGLTPHGYWRITFRGKAYPQHRIAFLFMTGDYPEEDVDHINRIRTDNRWCNLRAATAQENAENTCKNVETIGVNWHNHTKKWQARRRGIYLGVFTTYFAACYAVWVHDINHLRSYEE